MTIASRKEQVSDDGECYANSTSFQEAQEIRKDAPGLKQTFQPNRTPVELPPSKFQVEGERKYTGAGFTQGLPPTEDAALTKANAPRHNDESRINEGLSQSRDLPHK